MVLETDAPYLSKEPFDIPQLAGKVAELTLDLKKMRRRLERWLLRLCAPAQEGHLAGGGLECHPRSEQALLWAGLRTYFAMFSVWRLGLQGPGLACMTRGAWHGLVYTRGLLGFRAIHEPPKVVLAHLPS